MDIQLDIDFLTRMLWQETESWLVFLASSCFFLLKKNKKMDKNLGLLCDGKFHLICCSLLPWLQLTSPDPCKVTKAMMMMMMFSPFWSSCTPLTRTWVKQNQILLSFVKHCKMATLKNGNYQKKRLKPGSALCVWLPDTLLMCHWTKHSLQPWIHHIFLTIL